MKSRFVIRLLAVMVVFYSCQDSKAQKNDWQKEGLKGRVKEMKKFGYNTHIDTLIKVTEDDINYREKFIYNQNGNLIEAYLYYARNNGIGSKNIFKYNDKGNLIERTYYSPNGTFINKSTYKYDSKGNEIEEENYLTDDSLDSKSTYKYDENRNQIEISEYHSYNSFGYEITKCKYDSIGNKIEVIRCQSDGRITDRVTFKYDKNGNIMELHYYFYYPNPNIDFKITRKYDNMGNEIEASNYNYDGSFSNTITYRYEFDAFGNWTKKIEDKYNGETPYYIWEREIIYY